MRTIAGLVVALAALSAVTATPNLAIAKTPPRVQGQDCSALAASIGPGKMWQASYWARTTDLFGHVREFMLAPCFASKAKCEAWFYWAQSDWPDAIATQRCTKVR